MCALYRLALIESGAWSYVYTRREKSDLPTVLFENKIKRRSRLSVRNHRCLNLFLEKNQVEQLFCFLREFGKGVNFLFFVKILCDRINSRIF